MGSSYTRTVIRASPELKSSRLKDRPIFKQALKSWQLYILILPAIVYLFIFNYIPMYGLQIAFKDYRTSLGIMGSTWVGLKNFIRFLTYPRFLQILINTLRISLYLIATFPCSVILALMINELDSRKFKKTVQMITYMPHFISIVVICSMIQLFLNRSTGLLNNIVETLGGARIDFLAQPSMFASIFVWSDVWQGVGWGTVIYLAALSSVSTELVESAQIEGASRLKILLHINIPHIMPTIVIMLILRCGSVLNVSFEKIFLLQNSLNIEVSEVISTYVYTMGLINGQFSYSAAIGLFNTVINVIVLLFVNFICKRISSVGLW